MKPGQLLEREVAQVLHPGELHGIQQNVLSGVAEE